MRPTPVGVGTLDQVACMNRSVCLAAGSTGVSTSGRGLVLATSNGGSRWSKRTVPDGAGPLGTIFCLARSTDCWAGGNGGSGGDILATRNGGRTWKVESLPGSPPVSGISCGSRSRCWAAAGGAIYHTTNGGATWSLREGNVGSARVACVGTSHCWVAGSAGGSSNGAVFATTDGGARWVSQSVPNGVLKLYDVSCISTRDCWASGSGPVIIATTNGGTTWTTQMPGDNVAGLGGIWCSSRTSCWAVGVRPNDGSYIAAVYATRNGKSWKSQRLPPAVDSSVLEGITCPALSDCIVVGNRGAGAVILATGGSRQPSPSQSLYRDEQDALTQLCGPKRPIPTFDGQPVCGLFLVHATTPDGRGGTLFAIQYWAAPTSGSARPVYFFDGERLLANTYSLLPRENSGRLSGAHGPAQYVVQMTGFKLPYTGASCQRAEAMVQRDWIYRFNGVSMVVASAPSPPPGYTYNCVG